MNQNPMLLWGRTERLRGEWGLTHVDGKLYGLGKKNQSLWWIVQGLLGLELKWCGGLGKAARGTSPNAALHCGICWSLCYAIHPLRVSQLLSMSCIYIPQDNSGKGQCCQTNMWMASVDESPGLAAGVGAVTVSRSGRGHSGQGAEHRGGLR